jgi:hypothetical protein
LDGLALAIANDLAADADATEGLLVAVPRVAFVTNDAVILL